MTDRFCPGCGELATNERHECACGYECPEVPFPSISELLVAPLGDTTWDSVDLAAVLQRYRRFVVEECASEAVVMSLVEHVHPRNEEARHRLIAESSPSVTDGFTAHVPVANVPLPFLTEAATLLTRRWPCRPKHGCVFPGTGRGSICRARKHGLRVRSDDWCNCPCHHRRPPFGVVYHEGEVRTYVLVSSTCRSCGGYKHRLGDTDGGFLGVRDCEDCRGTGRSVDVGAVARYLGGDGNASAARFEVRR